MERRIWSLSLSGGLIGLFFVIFGTLQAQQSPFKGKIGKTFGGSVPGKAPVAPNAKGKPNVIWIMIDDAGY